MKTKTKTKTAAVEACYDCGSTIQGHHTAMCDLAGVGEKHDLPSKPKSHHWTGEVPEIDPVDEGKLLKAWGNKHQFIWEVHKLLEEYISEAEHQDGWEYWANQNFDDNNIAVDFGLYITNKNQP